MQCRRVQNPCHHKQLFVDQMDVTLQCEQALQGYNEMNNSIITHKDNVHLILQENDHSEIYSLWLQMNYVQ